MPLPVSFGLNELNMVFFVYAGIGVTHVFYS